MHNYFSVNQLKKEINLKYGIGCLDICLYDYIVDGDRLFMLYFSNILTSCDCDIDSQLGLIRLISLGYDDVKLVKDECCEFCKNDYDIGFLINGGHSCIHCFSQAKKIYESDDCEEYKTDGVIKLFIGRYNNELTHSFIGFIDTHSKLYMLNLINLKYNHGDTSICEEYYSPKWEYYIYSYCRICHKETRLNDKTHICYHCHKFVKSRFLRENAPKMLLLREICEKDIVLDIYYLIAKLLIC
jgi:hypothetical protein